MSRRYQRCRLIYEASLQLGRWSNLHTGRGPGPAHVRHGQSARTADLTFDSRTKWQRSLPGNARVIVQSPRIHATLGP